MIMPNLVACLNCNPTIAHLSQISAPHVSTISSPVQQWNTAYETEKKINCKCRDAVFSALGFVLSRIQNKILL